MQTKKLDIRFGVIAFIILIAAISRLLPHPPNVTPLSAMALFGAAHFSKRWQGIVVPLLAFWVSDLIINNIIYSAYFPTFTLFSKDFYFVAGSLILMTVLSWVMLKVVKVKHIITTSLVGSIVFFIITNFGTWVNWSMYPMTPTGLMTCYAAGLPFLLNSLIGDLLWCAILFGGFAWAQRRFSVPDVA